MTDNVACRVEDVSPAIRHDLQRHQQCTLKSMQTFLLKMLRPTLSDEALADKFDAAMKAAEVISVNEDVVAKRQSL